MSPTQECKVGKKQKKPDKPSQSHCAPSTINAAAYHTKHAQFSGAKQGQVSLALGWENVYKCVCIYTHRIDSSSH